MDIVIKSLLEGAKQATGSVAIIDVFRAFTSAAVALANGASEITMVGSVEEALALRQAGLGQVCMGEVGGVAPIDFDYGNSPFEISNVDFRGKSIIQRTSAGTQGIVSAVQADKTLRRIACHGAGYRQGAGARRQGRHPRGDGQPGDRQDRRGRVVRLAPT